MSTLGGGGGAPSFLQNSNLPSFRGPAASVGGAYNAMPGINQSLFGSGQGQTPGGGPTMQPPGPQGGPQTMGGPQGMPNVGMQPPGPQGGPQQMGGPSPGGMPFLPPQPSPNGGPPQTMGGPMAGMGPLQAIMNQRQGAGAYNGGGQGFAQAMNGGGMGGFNPAMLSALMAHMNSQGSGGMSPSLGGFASAMGGPTGGGPSPFAGMFARGNMGGGPMGPPMRQGPASGMPMNPGLLTR